MISPVMRIIGDLSISMDVSRECQDESLVPLLSIEYVA